MSVITVYLCGAIDKVRDKGIPWRTEVDKILTARGVKAVWPPGLRDGPSDWDQGQCLKTLRGCQVIAVRACENAGPGTRCEIAFAAWARIPILWWAASDYIPEIALKMLLCYGDQIDGPEKLFDTGPPEQPQISPLPPKPPTSDSGAAKNAGYSGEVCHVCHGVRTTRVGTCLQCLDCFQTTGCD